MLFCIHYEITPEHRDKALERFRKLGDGEPSGVRVLGNWFAVTQLEGWVIVDAADAMELAQLFHHWTDLNVNHITPVLDEDHMKKLLDG
ncbi:MAG: DUF3303 domain-containing protein [Planctomycetota bacterium]|nr:MAG: DUF3303 domain-containing protein [Planctomycetota bacterium]